jgi:tRNA threonylcarbamoyladenosine biosynthesis protein TsaE
MKTIIKSLKETKKYAKLFYKTLKGGEIILLNGDLGAGKTTFTKFLAECMGIKNPVTSPTFTLIQEYMGTNMGLIHCDMYRIEDESEVIEMGLEDMLYDMPSNKVAIIEWPNNIAGILKNLKTIKITIEKGEGDSRFITIDKD